MTFEIEHGNTTNITVAGKLDFANAPSLMEALSELKGKDISKIVFNCEELSYISSAGIRVIVFAKQKLSPDMEVVISKASNEVIEILEICGIIDIIDIV